MSIIVIGASGFIGGHLFAELTRRGMDTLGTQNKAIHPQFVKFDLSRNTLDDLGTEISDQTVLVMAASITDTNYCQEHPEASWDVNVTHTLRLIEAAAERGARVVFLSSDYAVGDGPQSEPALNYGKQKKAVEARIAACCRSYAIVRPGKVYSVDVGESTFLTEMCRKIHAGQPQNLVVDQLLCPIEISDLVSALIEIATASEQNGVFNLVGLDPVTRAELAMIAAKALGRGQESLRFVLRTDIGLDAYPRFVPLSPDWTRCKMSVFDAVPIVCKHLEETRD